MTGLYYRIRGVEWSLRAFASMRGVRLFFRARAVVKFFLRAESTLENTDGEQRPQLPWSQRFFLIFPRVREPRSGEKEKPLVTLDLNLTFMQMPAVKLVKFIISKWTNGNSVITCLSAPGSCSYNNPFPLGW